MTPVLAREDASKQGHGIQTAVVHLKRFAPRLSPEHYFKVPHSLVTEMLFP